VVYSGTRLRAYEYLRDHVLGARPTACAARARRRSTPAARARSATSPTLRPLDDLAARRTEAAPSAYNRAARV